MESAHPGKVRPALAGALPGDRRFVLASGSAIRKRILDDAGLDYEAIPSPAEEPRPRPGESAEAYVVRVAELKAAAVAALRPGELVVGCDQVVAFDGNVLTKVTTLEEAHQRLRLLSGKEHFLVNGLVLLAPGGEVMRHLEVVTVHMRELPDAVIARYLAEENPLSSVACYFLEGRGIRLIEDLEGSFHSALGLPLLSLMSLLERC